MSRITFEERLNISNNVRIGGLFLVFLRHKCNTIDIRKDGFVSFDKIKAYFKNVKSDSEIFDIVNEFNETASGKYNSIEINKIENIFYLRSLIAHTIKKVDEREILPKFNGEYAYVNDNITKSIIKNNGIITIKKRNCIILQNIQSNVKVKIKDAINDGITFYVCDFLVVTRGINGILPLKYIEFQ